MDNNHFTVYLSNCGNIDLGQNPRKPIPFTKCYWVVRETLKECADACQQYIAENDLGGGNWNGGQVYNEREEKVACISYNGRIWEKGSEYFKN